MDYGWRDQSMPRAKERSFNPQQDNSGEDILRAVITNLKGIILKHEATIERLQRQLAEEKVSNNKKESVE